MTLKSDADAIKLNRDITTIIRKDNFVESSPIVLFILAVDLVKVALHVSMTCNFDSLESGGSSSLVDLLASIAELSCNTGRIGERSKFWIQLCLRDSLDMLLTRSRCIIPANLISVMSDCAKGPDDPDGPLWSVLWEEKQSPLTQGNPSICIDAGDSQISASLAQISQVAKCSERPQDTQANPHSVASPVDESEEMPCTAKVHQAREPTPHHHPTTLDVKH
jgi:hypothetical protein